MRRSSFARAGALAITTCIVGLAFAKPPKRKRPPPPAEQLEASPAAQAPAISDASGETIALTVVEVAGSQAYLTPGAKEGIVRGTKVRFNRREFTVVQATDSFATIFVGNDPLHEQEKGRAVPSNGQSAKVVELDKPKPLSTWEHAWSKPAPPAGSQKPRFVPLGTVERSSRWDIRLSASAGALLPLGARGSNLFRGELGVRMHATPFDAPAAFDLDLAVQRWFDANLAARAGSQARPLVFVRELMASYVAAGFYGGLGRMRYAASTLGTLDGARASAPLGGGLYIGAFGGLLPDPLSGAPSVAGNRFGIEMSYSKPEAELRPDATLVMHGSTFQGRPDERRISGAFAIYPGPSRLGGHFEVSAFDASNPWKARPIELTAAGIDSSLRAGVFQLDGRFDLRQPERSQWLASYLPLSWFCTTVPSATPGAAEPCDGTSSTRAFGAVDAGFQVEHVSLLIGGTTSGDISQSGATKMTGGFATARILRIVRVLRIETSGSYSHATYADLLGGTGGPGLSLFGDTLDVSVYYRATSLRYRAFPESLLEHAVGGTLIAIPDTSVLLAFQGEAMTGDDVKALALFATITWRPEL